MLCTQFKPHVRHQAFDVVLAKHLLKVIKYYAWEKPFMKKVEETRKEEVTSRPQNIIFFIVFVDAFPQVGCIIKYHYMLSGLNVTYTVVSVKMFIFLR